MLFRRIHITPRPNGHIPLGALALAALLLLPLGAWIVESGTFQPGLCGLKAAIGYPCLTCGSTRATLHLLRADLTTAFAFQPMMITLYAILATWGIISLTSFALRRRVRISLTPAGHWTLRALLVAGPIMNWAYLIHAGI